jgi:16S rRNA (guanine1516-N2)-methyltransferase
MKAVHMAVTVGADPKYIAQAHGLAEALGVPYFSGDIVENLGELHEIDFLLFWDQGCLSLMPVYSTLLKPLCIDFSQGIYRKRLYEGLTYREPLARAVGLRAGETKHILDGTAGLCRDAFVLAVLGAKLTLVDRSPIVYALIEDARRRGMAQGAYLSGILSRMPCVCADLLDYIQIKPPALLEYDVIYLDPMFPEARKSALAKKEMQILQKICQNSRDLSVLLEASLEYTRERVVIKRSTDQKPICLKRLGFSITQRLVAFDVYLKRAVL